MVPFEPPLREPHGSLWALAHHDTYPPLREPRGSLSFNCGEQRFLAGACAPRHVPSLSILKNIDIFLR